MSWKALEKGKGPERRKGRRDCICATIWCCTKHGTVPVFQRKVLPPSVMSTLLSYLPNHMVMILLLLAMWSSHLTRMESSDWLVHSWDVLTLSLHWSWLFTRGNNVVVGTLISYWGETWFRTQPKGQLSWSVFLRFSSVFPLTCCTVTWQDTVTFKSNS
jgi:hypothetical protein